MSLVEEALRLRAHNVREQIESGGLRGAALLELIHAVPYVDRDAWIDELLGFEPPPPDSSELPRGAVPYLPCGVEEIVAMVREVPLLPSDHLVDLGSGLGRVVIVAHLLAGAHARGIEIQEHLVDLARSRCRKLRLPAVSFTHCNAADVELDGSVFFLYAPFNGEMAASVMRRLEQLARTRPFVVCTVGVELDEPWLVERATTTPALAIYDTRPPPTRSTGSQ